jgi:hypothetical protein
VKCGVPQGSTLGPLLFNVFINDICDYISNSKYLLFADVFKIYRSITAAHGCKILQSDVDSLHSYCFENGIILNVGKTTIISLHAKLLVFAQLCTLHVKLLVFTLIINCVLISFYVPSVSKSFEFC